VAAATARGAPTLSMPACPFGPTPEHRNFGSGYVDLPQTLHETLCFAVLVSLAEQGFRRLVIWQGCGGHRLQTVVRRFNTKNRGQAKAFLPQSPFHDIWCRVADPSGPGGHADSFATSISLYLRPQSVRQEQIVDPHNSPVDWGDPALDFARYSPTCVIGDPTQASAALGQKLWEASVAALVSALAEAASATL